MTGVPAGSPASIIAYPEVKQRMAIRQRAGRVFGDGTIAAGVMVFAALLAVVIANTDAYEVVRSVLEAPLSIGFGSFTASMSLEAFVNDFLMAIFFLLVGIELKYEVTVGELRKPRQAALPMLAAVGGVAAPAIIYLAVNAGGAMQGWAVPIATDIAFALGVMSLLGDRVAPGTKVFFSTLAIADDIIAIIVIAAFYGKTPSIPWLAASGMCIVILAIMNKRKAFQIRHYLVVGLALWVCVYDSGIHATLAGVILAFFLPVKSEIRLSKLRPWLRRKAIELDETYDDNIHVLGQHRFTRIAGDVERIMHHVTPPLERMERAITVPVNFVILPIFAFVNAQVRLVGVDILSIVTDPITIGAYVGAVLGKPIGIISVTALLVAIRFAKLPEGVDWVQIVGVGLMGGLGFTMSILIAGLAFSDPAHVLAVKCAILVGSLTAAFMGSIFLLVFSKRRDSGEASKEEEEEAEDEALLDRAVERSR